MNTSDIIQVLNKLSINREQDSGQGDIEDYDFLDRIEELCGNLRQLPDGYLACEALLKLFEKYPNREFGTPGEPVHTLETFKDEYEPFLLTSLNRQPSVMTIWMLNRVINASQNREREIYLNLLKQCITHPLSDDYIAESAQSFYEYQMAK